MIQPIIKVPSIKVRISPKQNLFMATTMKITCFCPARLLMLSIAILGLTTCLHVVAVNGELDLSAMTPVLDEQYYKVDPGHPDAYQPNKQVEPFKTCGECKCCPPGGSGECKNNVPCCFKIVCNLPGKPFGYCSFLPIACGCETCPKNN